MYNQTIQSPKNLGISTLQPEGQMLATFFLCTAQKLRMIFAFLKGYIREKNATDTAYGSQCLLSGPEQRNCASP